MVNPDDRSALTELLTATLGARDAARLLELMGGDDPVAALGLQGLPIEISAPGPPREAR